MSITVVAGCSARSVTSGADVDLLSIGSAAASPSGVAFGGAPCDWSLNVTTTQNITVTISLASGDNAGLVPVTGWTTLVTAAAPFVLAVDAETARRVRVQARASSTTAAVNADFIAAVSQ